MYSTVPLVAHDVHKAAAKQGKSNNEWNIWVKKNTRWS